MLKTWDCDCFEGAVLGLGSCCIGLRGVSGTVRASESVVGSAPWQEGAWTLIMVGTVFVCSDLFLSTIRRWDSGHGAPVPLGELGLLSRSGSQTNGTELPFELCSSVLGHDLRQFLSPGRLFRDTGQGVGPC